MTDFKKAGIKIESFMEFMKDSKKNIYEILCKHDLLKDKAGIALRTELYKDIAELLAKPKSDEKRDVEIKLYCGFVATELRGINQVPPREDPRYQAITDELKPIIEMITIKTEHVANVVMDELKTDIIKTVADIIEMDESGETSERILKDKQKYKSVRRCVKVLEKYDPLEFDTDGIRRTTLYIMLSLGLSGVEFPHKILIKKEYKSADDLKDFLYKGFEIVHKDHKTILPDKDSEKFNAMINDLWLVVSDLNESKMETEIT